MPRVWLKGPRPPGPLPRYVVRDVRRHREVTDLLRELDPPCLGRGLWSRSRLPPPRPHRRHLADHPARHVTGRQRWRLLSADSTGWWQRQPRRWTFSWGTHSALRWDSASVSLWSLGQPRRRTPRPAPDPVGLTQVPSHTPQGSRAGERGWRVSPRLGPAHSPAHLD